ncbi:MAG: TIGR01440 family protein [Peptococcia bacterium]
MVELSGITKEMQTALQELLAVAGLREKQLLVVGCSTSEVIGKKIGTASSMEVAAALWDGLYPLAKEQGIYLAIQCCEHLNRALVIEEEAMEKYNLEEVSVYPVQGAGGSLANQAMRSFQHPVVVEKIQAHAGIDIGDTFIGMHLRPVAVPVRGTLQKIGEAHLTMARTRAKLIGGERAHYHCD